jgi:hypothetical protein
LTRDTHSQPMSIQTVVIACGRLVSNTEAAFHAKASSDHEGGSQNYLSNREGSESVGDCVSDAAVKKRESRVCP